MRLPGAPETMLATTFFGEKLTRDDLELRALTRIHPTARQHEAELYTTKWFDYRLMHPAQATYLFAHCYEQAVRDIYAKTKDLEESLQLDVWKGQPDIFHRATDTLSVWRARQFCDRIGVRYDFALRFAMNRAADRGWLMFPRPNQLYEETLIRDVKDAWERHLEAIFETAKHPHYDLANYVGADCQDAYIAWLIARCNTRPRPQAPLSRCFREGQISREIALKHFEPRLVEEAYQSSLL